MNLYNNQELLRRLQKDIPVLTAQIRSLYAEFDKKYHKFGVGRKIINEKRG